MAQEQPLPKHGACCLASLNLSEFVLNPYKATAKFDWDSFIKAIPVAVNALDALIDENYYRQPLQEQREMSWNYRNIGLGAFGYATALMKLGIRYGSTEAIVLTDQLFDVLFVEAVKASSAAAKEKGSFPSYTERVWDSEIIRRHFSDDEINKMKEHGLRNCSLISIAPNGSNNRLM